MDHRHGWLQGSDGATEEGEAPGAAGAVGAVGSRDGRAVGSPDGRGGRLPHPPAREANADLPI